MIRVMAGERRSPSLDFRRRTLALGLLWSFALTSSVPLTAQEASRPVLVSNSSPAVTPAPVGSKTAGEPVASAPQPDAPPCPANADQLGFLYPKIPAAFVGGTIGGMPMSRGHLRRLNLFQADQFRVYGSLAFGSCDMVFTFAAKDDERPAVESDASFQVLPCQAGGLSSAGARLCQKDRAASSRGKSGYVIQVPYGRMNVLSRGRKGPGELNSDTATYLTAATAILTTVLGTVDTTSNKELYGGVTVFAASLA